MKKIIVVKIGRSIATSKRNRIDEFRFEHIARQVRLLQKHNIAFIFVVSGAVCCGEQELGLKAGHSISKDLLGGVGQATVIAQLYKIYSKHNLKIAQLLLTKHNLSDQYKKAHLATILTQAAEANITPIINENDIVELHSFNGNDYLATEIAQIVQAEKLLVLTDVEGVLDQELKLIKEYSIHQKLGHVTKTNYKGELGGMVGKVDAARQAATSGIDTRIMSGKVNKVLMRVLLNHEQIGTKVLGNTL